MMYYKMVESKKEKVLTEKTESRKPVC